MWRYEHSVCYVLIWKSSKFATFIRRYSNFLKYWLLTEIPEKRTTKKEKRLKREVAIAKRIVPHVNTVNYLHITQISKHPALQKIKFNVSKIKNSCFNPFLANVLILYPLKTPENQRFSGVFRGYKMKTLAWNGLKSWTRD